LLTDVGCLADYLLDDLISLLDAGMSSDHAGVIIDSDAMFSENMFGYSALRGRAAMRSRAGT
jgi:E3 ubiquitin-protein ligase EDD1